MAEQEAPDVQEIIRIASTDVDGTKRIEDAIHDIKGVSYAFANAVTTVMEFDPDIQIGSLSDDELKRIETVLRDPSEVDIPTWIRNRRKDRETGGDKHLIGSDLMMTEEFDIRRLKEIDSYRGKRHKMGLPVRGQQTQSSFRSGEKIGVQRERIQEEAEPDSDDDE
jgi:small subunit ribosomal protein S13